MNWHPRTEKPKREGWFVVWYPKAPVGHRLGLARWTGSKWEYLPDWTHWAEVEGPGAGPSDTVIRHKCACWFDGGKLIEECHYHACLRSGRAENGDPVSWVTGGKEIHSVCSASPSCCAQARAEALREAAEKMRSLSGQLPDLDVAADMLDDMADAAERGEK